MDLYFPNTGWLRLRRETLDALQRYKTERALLTWDETFERLLKEAGGRMSRRSHTTPRFSPDRFASARLVADTVLYEGYVLYPYRASAQKNQLRWQFGVLAPPDYAKSSGAERSSMRSEVIVDPGRPARD